MAKIIWATHILKLYNHYSASETHHQFITGMKTIIYIANPKDDS